MTFDLNAGPERSGQDVSFSAPVPVDDPALGAVKLRRLGLSLWVEGRLIEATEILASAARLAPSDPRILSDLGSLLCATLRQSEAIPYLAASLEIDPGHPPTWLLLANAAHTLGDTGTAEHAFLAALELAPNSAEALTGLGLLYFELRRFDGAARLLTAAVANQGTTAPAVYACLAEARRILGQFREARKAFEKAAAAFPDEAAIQRKYARVALIDTAIDEPVETAMATYARAAGRHAEARETVLRDAFQALCGFGHKAGAIRLAGALLDLAPEDPVIRYHLDALEGLPHTRAPDAYLTVCFDKYAPDFERHLTEVLGYNIPGVCEKLLAETGETFANILDLGCGTGLAAPFLRKFGEKLTGVDISRGMLAKARERGLYDRLVESEASAFLAGNDARFDLVTALDVLVYFGDLAALFDSVARRLTSGGIFVLSFETAGGADYRLRPSGRFAHDPNYVASLAAANFTTVARVVTTLRLEANAPVAGEVLVLRRL
jgi:predicted TPR repeat methyltransferase